MYPSHSGEYLIEPDEVVVPDAFPAADEKNVARIVETLKQGPWGDLIYPILLHSKRDSDGSESFELIDGLDRLAAYKLLERPQIPFWPVRGSAASVELMRLSTLVRKNISPSEQAMNTVRAAQLRLQVQAEDEAWEAEDRVRRADAADKAQKARRIREATDAAQRREWTKYESDSLPYATAEAERTGREVRLVQLEFRRYRNVLSRPEVRKLINSHRDRFDNVRFLDKLAGIRDEKKQLKLMCDVLSGAYAKAAIAKEVAAAERAVRKLTPDAKATFVTSELVLDALRECGYNVQRAPETGTVVPLRAA